MIKLRIAEEADKKIIFDWQNAPGSRQYFFNPEPLEWEAHCQWFKKVLNSPHHTLLMAELEEKIGFVRLDLTDTQVEISIMIAPNMRGKGFSESLIKTAVKWTENYLPEVDVIHAQILNDNIASIKAFEKSGFKQKSSNYELRLSK